MSGVSNTLPFKLYGITDRWCVRTSPWTDHLHRLAEAGLRALQIREKDLSARELLDVLYSVRRASCSILINDRADLCAVADLAGVHLTETSMPASMVRRVVGRRWIGVSCHSLNGAIQAEAEGADFVVVGPVAATTSKPEGHSILGESEFRNICATLRIPVFALGGVQVKNAERYLRWGAWGIAGISIVMEENNLEGRLKALADILGGL